MSTAASAGQTAVWTILTIGSYLWIVLWIGRRLGDASDQLEESQERMRQIRTDLDVADYVDGLGQHWVREWDDGAFALDSDESQIPMPTREEAMRRMLAGKDVFEGRPISEFRFTSTEPPPHDNAVESPDTGRAA